MSTIRSLLIPFIFFALTACKTTYKTQKAEPASSEAVLQFYESEIAINKNKTQFVQGRSQVWTQSLDNSSGSEELIKRRRDSFLLFFKDETEPYTNKIYKYSSCLVDDKMKDRIIFYYGDINHPTNCLKQELRTVAMRLWKQCGRTLYEVTIGPLDVMHGISIVCK
jgi:hypothetical protein